MRQLAAGRFTDALSLDANYVRRSDAEIFGRAWRMEAETKREPSGATVRPFLIGDAAAATEILRASPEAAQWTEWGF